MPPPATLAPAAGRRWRGRLRQLNAALATGAAGGASLTDP